MHLIGYQLPSKDCCFRRRNNFIFGENFLIFLEGRNKRIQWPAQTGTAFAHVVEMVCYLNHFTLMRPSFTNFHGQVACVMKLNVIELTLYSGCVWSVLWPWSWWNVLDTLAEMFSLEILYSLGWGRVRTTSSLFLRIISCDEKCYVCNGISNLNSLYM